MERKKSLLQEDCKKNLLKQVRVCRIGYVFPFLLSFLFLSITLFPTHNVSKYFPFFEKPEEYVTRNKSYICPSLFITTAATAFGSGGSTIGIPEIWGRYNLQKVVAGLSALKTSQGISDYNPFENEIGYTNWNEESLAFKVDGKIKSRGVMLNIGQNLFKSNFSFGCFFPIMNVSSSLRFTFDRENSDAVARYATIEEEEMVNRVRRQVHTDLGLKGDDWTESGIGDVDAYIQWRKWWDHKLKMRTIDLNVRGGVLFPTGRKRHEDFPSSIPFMGNGHWGIYGDILTEFELKQNWRLGFLFGVVNEFSKTAERRIPYFTEPPIFSALVGDVEVDPGLTIKASSYFTLENVRDGVHFQARYTYRRHKPDTWNDKRADKTVLSYLDSTQTGATCVRYSRKRLSLWTAHHITVQLEYNSVDAMKNWWLKPNFYALFDYALSGRGVSKTHQLTVGVQFHPW